MELQSEADVFGGGASDRGVSNGNKSHFGFEQSSPGKAGQTQTSCSSLLSALSGRRTRSHQPHHGTLSSTTLLQVEEV